MLDQKPWYLSRTIWGALLAVAASVANSSGIAISESTQGELADIMVSMTGAAGALVAIYGRLNATDMIL